MRLRLTHTTGGYVLIDDQGRRTDPFLTVEECKNQLRIRLRAERQDLLAEMERTGRRIATLERHILKTQPRRHS